MKKIIFFTFYIASIALIFSQEKTTIVLRNGDTLQGYSYIKENMRQIKFQKEIKGKKTKYGYKAVKKILFRNNIYEFKVREGGIYTPKLYKLQIKGKVNLYRFDFIRTSRFETFTMEGSEVEYSVCKNNSDVVTVFSANGIGIERSFRKKAISFFDDCPEVIEKIKNKIWKMNDLPQIVSYYNNQCSSN